MNKEYNLASRAERLSWLDVLKGNGCRLCYGDADNLQMQYMYICIIFINVGAYDGDTIRLFLKENQGNYKEIYALEPDKKTISELKNYVETENLKHVHLTTKGAWNCVEKLEFMADEEQLSGVAMETGVADNVTIIETDKLDDLFSYEEPVALIKVNYCYGVKEALAEAARLLTTYQPKLAIAVGFLAVKIFVVFRS